MAAITYPASLPCPQVAPIRSVERRLLTDGGPRVERTVQRDWLAIQQIIFPPMSPTEALAFDTWWREVLYRGGAWFAATWPLPQGMVEAVRKFLGPPRWDFIPAAPGGDVGGYWRISAACEVRGRGAVPPYEPLMVYVNLIAGGLSCSFGIFQTGCDADSTWQVTHDFGDGSTPVYVWTIEDSDVSPIYGTVFTQQPGFPPVADEFYLRGEGAGGSWGCTLRCAVTVGTQHGTGSAGVVTTHTQVP